LKNGNRKPTNKRVKEYHNVIKQERKPGPLDLPTARAAWLIILPDPAKGPKGRFPGRFSCFLYVKFV